MKKEFLLILSAILMFCMHIAAQINPKFQNLNFQNTTTGYFWNQVSVLNDFPNGTEYVYLDFVQATQILSNIREADIDTTTIDVPSFQQIKSEMNQMKIADHVIPISIIEMKMDLVSKSAIDNEWIFVSDSAYHQISNVNIFDVDTALILYIDIAKCIANDLQFMLSSEHYFQNFGSMPSAFEIDFDDGLGFQLITLDTPVLVHYNTVNAEREIKLRLTRDGLEKKSGYRMGGASCILEYDEPVIPVPWQTNLNDEPWLADHHWRIATTFEGEEICGNAYYLPSGAFDKPFIFVEGIDFPNDRSATANSLRNGDFGWCEFTSSTTPGDPYYILALMPNLLEEVRAHGYDIVLLDFCYGADELEKNGMLLVHLIEMIVDAKQGAEPLVIAGASMGGQVSRFAIDYMERNDMEHCTRLWISLDSPHTGANVPIGMQQFLYGLAQKETIAEQKFEERVLCPASKQLLNIQVLTSSTGNLNPGDPNLYPVENLTWYGKMEEWGYPKLCRTVGIANGSMTGVRQKDEQGNIYSGEESILDYKCNYTTLIDGYELMLGIDPPNNQNVGTYPTPPLGLANTDYTAHVKLFYPKIGTVPASAGNGFIQQASIWLNNLGPNLINLGFSDVYDRIFYCWDTPNWDYAPGGFRNSVVEIVDAVNDVENLTAICEEIDEANYNTYHCFVPTQSALGLSGLDPYLNIRQYLIDNPNDVKFDFYFGPDGNNQPHSAISPQNYIVFTKEIFLGENSDGSPLLPFDFSSQVFNNGIFNYGIEGFNYIRSVHIHNGGQVYVNKNQVLHYGLNGESDPQEGIFKITTWSGCAASDILVDDMGKLEIGDAVDTRRAELTLRPDSKLTIGESGILKINPGSKIIIEDGAELIIYPFSSVTADNGSIIVKAGGKLTIHAGTTNGDVAALSLLNTDAVLVFDGGELHIAANTMFEINQGNASTSGYVEFKGADDHELFTGSGSIFKIIGDGTNDVMLKMNGYADLWNANPGLGTIYLKDCKVDLTDHGRLWTDMKMQAFNVTFEDTQDVGTAEGGNVQVWWNNWCTMSGCKFNGVLLKNHYTYTNLSNAQFNGLQSGFESYFGSYAINGSAFNDSHVKSNSLYNLS